MSKDTLFQKKRERVTPFAFDAEVARVFDDMIRRSVPGYEDVIAREAQMAASHYIPGSRIYDLGCSTGNLEAALSSEPLLRNAAVIAVDNAPAMLKAFAVGITSMTGGPRIHPLCMDICDIRVENASVVVINFTLQFITPTARESLLTRIWDGLAPGGILLMAEKIIHPNESIARLHQCFYYRFKRENGYSELEISQKRDALEKVLIPDAVETHLARLSRIGFEAVDIWFKWFNFAAFIARKA